MRPQVQFGLFLFFTPKIAPPAKKRIIFHYFSHCCLLFQWWPQPITSLHFGLTCLFLSITTTNLMSFLPNSWISSLIFLLQTSCFPLPTSASSVWPLFLYLWNMLCPCDGLLPDSLHPGLFRHKEKLSISVSAASVFKPNRIAALSLLLIIFYRTSQLTLFYPAPFPTCTHTQSSTLCVALHCWRWQSTVFISSVGNLNVLPGVLSRLLPCCKKPSFLFFQPWYLTH